MFFKLHTLDMSEAILTRDKEFSNPYIVPKCISDAINEISSLHTLRVRRICCIQLKHVRCLYIKDFNLDDEYDYVSTLFRSDNMRQIYTNSILFVDSISNCTITYTGNPGRSSALHTNNSDYMTHIGFERVSIWD